MHGLSLLAKEGLWALLLVPPLVALYILKVRRRRAVVASTWLWQSAQRDLLAKSPFKKLVAQLSLLLQLLALVLLALALARPAFLSSDAPGRHVAIVVDVSASMSASAEPGAPNGTTRLDKAKDAALALVASLPPGSEAMVIAAGRDARVAAPLDRDLRRTEAAIRAIAAEDVEGDVMPALSLAVDRLKGFDDAKITLLTDGNLAREPALGSLALPLELVKVGAPLENTAIVRSDVRLGRAAKGGAEEVQAFLVLESWAAAPREVFVTVRRPDAPDPLDARRLLIQPREPTPVVLSFAATAVDYKQPLLFEVSPHDDLAVDDSAWARVPAGQKLPVVLLSNEVGKASPWLERVLAADPDVTLLKATAAELAAHTDLDEGALIVSDGLCPSEEVPGGDLVIVHPPAGRCFGVEVGAPVERPQLTSWESSDPRLRFLTLDGVGIASAAALTPASPAGALVRARDSVVVADATTAARSVTLIGFDVGESDWPLKASYVLFMRNVTELARAHRMSGFTGAAVVGEPLRVNVPQGATEVVALDPSGAPLEASLRGGLVIVPSVARVGLYKISYEAAQPGTVWAPVNLSSAAESDLSRAIEPPASATVTVRSAEEVPERYRDLSWILAAVALALLLFEVIHHTRAPKPSRAGVALPKAPERRRA